MDDAYERFKKRMIANFIAYNEEIEEAHAMTMATIRCRARYRRQTEILDRVQITSK